MIMRAIIPADKGTEALKDGSMLPALQAVMDQLKPEAAYFFPSHGQRTAIFVFDMPTNSDLAPTVEPFWIALGADVEIVPAMNFADLQAGLAKLPPS
jgi:hypothetical protein